MSERTTNLMNETVEKYRAFRESLQETVASIETDMGNIEVMSQQVELHGELYEERDRLRVNVENAARKPEDIASRFEELQEIASFLKTVEYNVAKLVLGQAERTRAKTESAIEMARTIAGSD